MEHRLGLRDGAQSQGAGWGCRMEQRPGLRDGAEAGAVGHVPGCGFAGRGAGCGAFVLRRGSHS